MSFESIRALVNEDLSAIDRFIITQLESKIPLVKEMIEYVLTCGGKRVRPIVLLLSAKALNPKSHQHIDLAAAVELVHTATLLHDDVVDKSTLRRGHKTANIIWGNATSILVGDFLYSRAFQVVVNQRHPAIIDIFANSTHFITEGEIMQLTNCKNPDTTEQYYFDIIHRKTAKLFEVAAQFGAMLASTNEPHIHALRDYGMHLGMAYQLIDDALDYAQSAEQTGKNIGQDLSEGKNTLPLIHAMQKSKGADLELLRHAIKNGESDELENILGIIESTDAIKYTADTAKHHARQAREALENIPASPYRKALEDLSEFVVERTY